MELDGLAKYLRCKNFPVSVSFSNSNGTEKQTNLKSSLKLHRRSKTEFRLTTTTEKSSLFFSSSELISSGNLSSASNVSSRICE